MLGEVENGIVVSINNTGKEHKSKFSLFPSLPYDFLDNYENFSPSRKSADFYCFCVNNQVQP